MTFARRSSRIIVIALAALLASTGWPASAARAADDTNIPGVPLPGPVVTGLLGGPIYDHVYGIDVPAASVLLLSLTGDSGTDFDLYLFDSTATSVYFPDGQVAQSTGPTSTESISYATISGGHFYIDLNGATNVEGQFRLVVSIAADSAPPEAAIRLNGGAKATQDRTVRVTLIGTDDLSGVGDMQLSVDGVVYGAFVPYTPTFLWEFAAGDGPKQLWARVRDRAGNLSAAATATIALDTTAPTIIGRYPEPGGTAVGLRPTISVRFSEPIDPQTWLHQGLVVQHVDGSTITGTYEWDEATSTGSFVPTLPLVAGQPVACTLAGITDLAGNPLLLVGTWLITPLQVHVITAQALPTVVTSGGRATIVGSVDGPVATAMTLERNDGTGWVDTAGVLPNTTGAFSASVVVTQNTQFRVRANASQLEASSASPVIRVIARRGVTLVGISSARLNTASRGTTVRLTAQLTPAGPAVPVTATVTRFDSSRHAWVTAATLRATSVSGRATVLWRPSTKGSYRVRLTTPTTSSFASGLSALYLWKVV